MKDWLTRRLIRPRVCREAFRKVLTGTDPESSALRDWLVDEMPQPLIDLFHRIYYHRESTWAENTFLGQTILQCPFDLQIYQELIVRLRPAFILQTGIAHGGSLLYFATLLDLIGADPGALVIGIDIAILEGARSLTHPRIRLIEGSSTDLMIIDRIRGMLPAMTGMVILDSDHSQGHVAREVEIYREFVGVGSYLVVEDTNINGHPVHSHFGPGPREAVEEFLRKDDHFIQDDELWQRHTFSFHQRGWLRRIR